MSKAANRIGIISILITAAGWTVASIYAASGHLRHGHLGNLPEDEDEN